MERSREQYEQAVLALRGVADQRLAEGESEEPVARYMVLSRNRLKAEFRVGLDPRVLRRIEARNRMRYGDPIGPTADAMLARYGTWRAVIDAAARPADLSASSEMHISEE